MSRSSTHCYVVASSVSNDTIPLEVAPGSTVSQVGLATVTLGVTASGGTAPYSYEWALYAPDNTDQTGLLSDNEVAAPTFTPLVKDGQWVAICVVTDANGAVATAVQRVIIGDNGFVQVWEYESDGTTNVSTGATLAYGGKTWTVLSADGDSGPKVVNGDIVITPAPAIQMTGSSIANVAGLRIALSSFHASLSAMAGKSLAVFAEISSYSPTTNDERFVIGIGASGAGFGAGASARAVGGGQGRTSATNRAGVICGQGSATLSTAYATAVAATADSFAVVMSNGGAAVYSSTTPNACDTPTKIAAMNPQHQGGAVAGVTFADLTVLDILVQRATAGANGVPWVLEYLSVWVKP